MYFTARLTVVKSMVSSGSSFKLGDLGNTFPIGATNA